LDDIGKTLGALTDVRMPGSLNGLKLTNTLKRGKSGLHVILMRGYNKEMLNASAFQGVGFRFFYPNPSSSTRSTACSTRFFPNSRVGGR
jgi:CheY-like chemotaxis protein